MHFGIVNTYKHCSVCVCVSVRVDLHGTASLKGSESQESHELLRRLSGQKVHYRA